MNIDKFEIWVHDHVLKNDTIRHMAYGAYQRALYLASPKMDYEGPIEKITPDDGYEYLFGYYDKCPWSDDGRYLLALKVKNASSEPDSTKPAEIVRIELSTKKVDKLATTHSWNVQQGCMAQWLSADEILYNDFRDGKYCAVILNLENRSERIIDMPVYAMSPDRTTALSLDFSRLHRLRPGYGYGNVPETTKNEKCPDTTCIWKIDIATGSITPLLKYTDFASFEPKENMAGAEHKVNHLMISPNGKRFMVLHRWFQNGVKYTRLVTCNMDGTDMFNLSDDDFVSHCCWKNDVEILSYLNKNDGGKGYYLMKDRTHEYERKWPELIMDGHPTYSYDGNYVVTDTYPDRRRIQSIYLMNEVAVKKIAKVFSPFKYSGDTRCDLHPRLSKTGEEICFDASFGGKRGVYSVRTNIQISDQKLKESDILLTIVIPMYNASLTVERAIKSVINQKNDRWELIVIDDGSTDNCSEIVKKYTEIDPRIRLIEKNNEGPGATRNLGIQIAKGNYVAFLDSDDYIVETYVENIVKCVQSEEPDLVFFEMAYEEQGKVIRQTHMCNFLDYGKETLLRNQLSGNAPWSSLVKVVRVNYLRDRGIYFSNDQVGEEALYSYRLLHETDRISSISEVMYYAVSSENGQHKKGKDDPWWDVASNMKKSIRDKEIPEKYDSSINSLGAKALTISLYRISKSNSLIKSIPKMISRIKKYNSMFDFARCDKQSQSKEAKLMLPFIRTYFVFPIYIAARLRGR